MGNNKREIVHSGAMLEGAKCEIYTRKEVFKGLHKDPITSVNMIKYELCRNCSVEITKEHILTDELEREKRENLGVFRSLGDKLKGDSITVFVEQKIPLTVTVVEGATATHGGRFMSTKKRTIANIKYQFDNLPERLNAPVEPLKITDIKKHED